MLWGSGMSSDFLQWRKPKCDLFCGQSFEASQISTAALTVGVKVAHWKEAPITELHLWSFLGHTHPLPSQGRTDLSQTLFHACWFVCQPVQTCTMPVEAVTVVINAGFLTQHLASSGAMQTQIARSPLHTARAGRTWDGLYSCFSYWLAA